MDGGQVTTESVNSSLVIVEDILRPYKKKDGSYTQMRAYLDLTADKESLGRVEIDMLNPDRCPKTVANFLALCAGLRTDVKGDVMSYKWTNIFRVVPKFCMCAGDTFNGDGFGGRSIYSRPTFDDENSGISHDRPGIVTMLQQNGCPNTNGSQFAIVLVPALWLDRINVAFGLVTSGLDVVERACEKYASENGVPSKLVRILDCGIK